MKKQLILAVITLAAITFAVVSCQKEEASTNHPTTSSKQVYQPPQVEDMVAYLKDFKQKIQSRDGDETMTLDEAAWHLSSLANYDYGDVRKDFSDFHYDTLYSHINVSNGTVSMADINTAYSNIASAVEAFYQNTDLEDAAPRFIDVAIDGNGLVAVSLMTSYRNIWDHLWYFSDVYSMDTILNNLGVYFNSCYPLYGNFVPELQRVLNILTSDGGQNSSGGSGRIAYIEIRIDSLMYGTLSDPYFSCFHHNSRVLYFQDVEPDIYFDTMAYCVDSYAALALESLLPEEVIVNWPELPIRHYTDHSSYYTYQVPKIKYGVPLAIIDNPQN